MRRLNWLNIFLAIVLVIVGIVIFFTFRHSSTDTTEPTATSSKIEKAKQKVAESKQKATETKPAPKSSPTTEPKPATPAPSPTSAAPTTSPTTAAPSATPSSPTAATPTKLTNTGPGDVVGLAFVAMLLGGLSRYVQLSRKLVA
jgi:cytoskeletal protein RodZ